MRLMWLLITVFLALPAWADQSAPNVTVELNNVALPQALETLTKQTGVPVVAGASARGTVTLTLKDVPIEQAVATIASLNGLRWRRVDLAVSKESKVSADQVAGAISALELLSVSGIAIADKERKTQTVFGKDMPLSSLPQLADGWRWQVVYLVQKPETAGEQDSKPASSEQATEAKARLSTISQERLELIQTLTPQERELLAQDDFGRLLSAPEDVRRDVIRGMMTAVRNMGESARHEFFQEMRDVMRQTHPEGPPFGRPEGPPH